MNLDDPTVRCIFAVYQHRAEAIDDALETIRRHLCCEIPMWNDMQ